MRFIGDVHGKFDRYLDLIAGVPTSVQVGDFGVGFAPVPKIDAGHRFIRGNHDDPGRVALHNWIPDGTFEDGMLFVGGGESIDRLGRIEGVEWWPDEQLSIPDLYRMVDVHEASRPDVVVSHECPSHVVGHLFGREHVRYRHPSRTSQALGSMLHVHRPQTWIFGHWHRRVDRVFDGTRFLCLEELGHVDL